MLKKISVAILLTVLVLAFPVRLFGLPETQELGIKIAKGLIFIMLIIHLMRRHGIFRRELLFKKMSRNILVNLIPVIVLVICYLIYGIGKQSEEFSRPALLIALALLSSFVAAAAEEVVFRGYIFNVLNRENNSLRKNLLITSAIFALIHLVNIFRYADIWSVLNQIVFALALGMLFGSIYVLTKNLVAVAILHFFVNVPSALQTVRESNEVESEFLNSGFLDNIISLSFMIILMLPFLMLALHYINIAVKQNIMITKTS